MENYELTQDEKSIAMLSHLLCFFGGFIAPLVIYLVKKDESSYVSEHAKESLNFQITLIIGAIASLVLTLVFVGILLLFAIGICSTIFIIIASIRAYEGIEYSYPINIRFIK
jgi:uncharacterized Tic20 family protein